MTRDEMTYVPCECHTAYHFVRFERDEDVEGSMIVSFVSTRSGSFWHRAKWAFKHIFGSQDLVFADIIVQRATLLAALRSEDKQ